MIDKDRALEVVEFIQLLKLPDDFFGQPFVLQDWQYEIIWDVYGTVKENGLRQYKYAYLEIPKKNGKTTMIAGLGIYHLTCDPPGGQIYCCAAEKKQAGLVYKAAKQMIEQDPLLDSKQGGILKVTDSLKQIENLETGTVMTVLSAEAYSKHGINPTVVIFDELHAQPNRELWDVMTFGSGSARREPLYWVITTAGDDPDKKSIGWEVHEKACKIRDGEIVLPTWYVKIYGAPEDADIYDEAVWHAVNPSLGVSINIDVLREEAAEAKASPHVEKNFRWLRLNQWVQLKKIGWLPITLWDQTEAGKNGLHEWSPKDLLGKRCYVGIDLARRIDLAATVPLFPPQGEVEDWRFLIDAYIPEGNMKERIRRDHITYDRWEKERYLKATPGDVIDYGVIKSRIEEYEALYDVAYYCADPWNLDILKQLLDPEIASKFVEISQTIAGMTTGMSELETMFRAFQISHQPNPLGRWCFGNVIVATDGNNNIKPMKNKSIDRIDPIVALINAANGAIKLEPARSVYETRGMRSLA